MTQQRSSCRPLRWPWLALLFCAPVLLAQDSGALNDEENAPIITEPTLTLAEAVSAAYSRAPGAATLAARTAATASYQRRSQSLIAGAPSLQLRYLSDRLQSNRGVTEAEGGVDLPLWRWGQRQAVAAEADANRSGAEDDLRLQRWQVAGAVRESFWDVREAQQRLLLAQRDVAAFTQLEHDVLRRIAAGDAAPSERLTAEGQRREREAALHEAEVVLADRYFSWRAITGLETLPGRADESIAPETTTYLPLDAARTAAARADSAVSAAKAEGAGAPRLLLGYRAETANGAPDVNSVSAQLTIPFAGGSHRQAALAPLSLLAAQARDHVLQMQREALIAHHEAEHELHAREVALADASGRLRLAQDEVGLARRAYTLGEIPLAERLLTEIRAADAARAQELAVVAHGRAIARFNQINGVLP
ncbi:MAG: TolC family protein [Nevskia sp.]|nr:TolC family protein [Nevskia sp.]MCK9386178.1 TolC family protein [Nevskia sp.]